MRTYYKKDLKGVFKKLPIPIVKLLVFFMFPIVLIYPLFEDITLKESLKHWCDILKSQII